jgi:hypothetical protein
MRFSVALFHSQKFQVDSDYPFVLFFNSYIDAPLDICIYTHLNFDKSDTIQKPCPNRAFKFDIY